jgi:hypothetical protein
MKKLLSLISLPLLLLPSACAGGDSAPDSTQRNASEANQPNAAQVRPAGGGDSNSTLGVVSSHGGGGAAAPAAGANSDRGLLDTKALDERIREAAAKAKAPGASESDRKAAAQAYLARGDVYFNAGQPRLYKYALADLKQVIRYDPGNEEAAEKIKTIEDIYRGMNRPIPEVPAEQ